MGWWPFSRKQDEAKERVEPDFRASLEDPNTPINADQLAFITGGGPTMAGPLVSEATAIRCVDVYRCVSILSGLVASLRMNVYRTVNDKRDLAETHRLYLRYGLSEMPADLRAAAQTRMQSIDAAAVGRFMAAQSTASDVGGGYLVPESFDAALEKAELVYSGMMEVAAIMNTATGNDIHWPTANDTANKGRILGENTQVTENGVSFGTVKIGAYTFSSDMVLVSNELLQDSAINLDSLLTDLLGERIGRKANEVFTTGSGASVPYGIVTQSWLGVTAASATALSLDEVFFDLPHSIGRAYRSRGRFMFNDSTLKAIRKMKDGDGLPIWQADLRVGAPDTVGGFAYTINDDMADIGTGAKSVLFGDFSKYRIRRVAGARVLRLNERYADYGQVAFLAFQRMDGVLTDAGAHPIKYILHP